MIKIKVNIVKGEETKISTKLTFPFVDPSDLVAHPLVLVVLLVDDRVDTVRIVLTTNVIQNISCSKFMNAEVF